MQTNLLWTGQEYYSLENCLVNTTDIGSEINSVIIGKYGEKIYRVEYKVKTNQNWETIYVEIQCQHSNQREQSIFESDGNGNWMMNGKQADQFKGCIDIDIPLTPFTNTLPINRLKLRQAEEHQIQVIYLDLLEKQILPLNRNIFEFLKQSIITKTFQTTLRPKLKLMNSDLLLTIRHCL